jgi:hypothetical protein
MRMKTKLVMATGSLIVISACATVESESRSTIVVDGASYELRTQVIDGRNGPCQHSSVVVKNRLYTCLPDSPGDCEAAVRLARTDFERE